MVTHINIIPMETVIIYRILRMKVQMDLVTEIFCQVQRLTWKILDKMAGPPRVWM